VRGDRALWAILAVALLLRLAVVVTTPDFVPVGDPADYNRIGTAIAVTGGYPATQIAEPGGRSAFRPPGYPLLLGAVYKVAGAQSWTAARLVGALLGVASVLLLYLLVVRLYSPRLARWSAWIAALAPPLVYLNGTLLSESLFIPLMLGMALCVTAQRQRGGGLGLAAAAGLLLGAAIMTRSNGLSLMLPLALGVAGGPGLVRRLVGVVVAGLCVLVVLTPWTVRNENAFGRFLPLGAQAGFTMAGQWNSVAEAPGDFNAVWQLPQNVPEYAPLLNHPGIDEGELDERLRALATGFAKRHRGHMVKATLLNLIRSFDLGPGHAFVSGVSFQELGLPEGQDEVMRWSSYLLCLLGVIGLLLALRRERWRERGWLYLLPLLVLAGGVLWIGNPRHAAPLFPFIAIAAAHAAITLRDRVARSRAS
jgi:4-amino-4-deoxy-L-arabinose transferase-like glycosyltransferase